LPTAPQELQSEADAKLKESERLRAAEKFMTVTEIADMFSIISDS